MRSFRYPVTLELTGRPCLVVGGGAVAERKVEGLLDAGARVTVVSPRLTPGLLELARDGRFAWWPREWQPEDLAGVALCMVATADGAINAEVWGEAQARGIWTNCADDPGRCDFILPAVHRRGPLTVAVSTGGASPLMARRVRDELATRLPEGMSALTEVVARVRQALRREGRSADVERWSRAVDDDLCRLVTSGQADEAERRLRERLGV